VYCSSGADDLSNHVELVPRSTPRSFCELGGVCVAVLSPGEFFSPGSRFFHRRFFASGALKVEGDVSMDGTESGACALARLVLSASETDGRRSAHSSAVVAFRSELKGVMAEYGRLLQEYNRLMRLQDGISDRLKELRGTIKGLEASSEAELVKVAASSDELSQALALAVPHARAVLRSGP